MNSFIDQINNKIDFLSKIELETVFQTILSTPNISSTELIQKTGLPKETLKKLKALLSNIFIDTNDDSINIKEEYINQFDDLYCKYPLIQYSHPTFEQHLSNIRSVLAQTANRSLDQFYATPRTTFAKYQILKESFDLNFIRVALLGDDDLVTLAFDYFKDYPLKLTTFDVDAALLENISKSLSPLGKDATNLITYDARHKLSPDKMNTFDVVVTDPPYTKAGVSLFLNRALELLGKATDKYPKYIYLYWGTSKKTPEKTLKVQDIISKMNLVIENTIDNFAQYVGAESIGDNSSLYVLKVTPFSVPSAVCSIDKNIYTHENYKQEKFPYVDHVTAKLYSVPDNLLKSKVQLGKAIEALCKTHRLKIVDEKITRFKGEGMSLTFILSNSNLLVHTWPELNAVHIDLLTCTPIYDKVSLVDTLTKSFGTNAIELNFVE